MMKIAGHFGEQDRVDVSSHTACLFRETILNYGNPMYHVSLARLFILCLSLYASASAFASASRFSYSSCSNPINGLVNGRRIFVIINIPNHTIPTSLSCSLDRCFFTSCSGLYSRHTPARTYTPRVFLFLGFLPPSNLLSPAAGDLVLSLPPQRFPCSPPRSHTSHSLVLFLYVLDETLGRGAQ